MHDVRSPRVPYNGRSCLTGTRDVAPEATHLYAGTRMFIQHAGPALSCYSTGMCWGGGEADLTAFLQRAHVQQHEAVVGSMTAIAV